MKKRTRKGSVFAMFQKLSVNDYVFQNIYEENEKSHIHPSYLLQKNQNGGMNHMENKKRIRISVEIDEAMNELLQERVEYLQSKRAGSKVTVSDAIRHALSYTGYKRGKKNSEEE